jgi:hypothetical protein
MNVARHAILACLVAAALAGCASAPAPRSPDPRYAISTLLFRDDFRSVDPSRWRAELEQPGSVTARDGRLDIDVPAGCTLWFAPRLTGPVMIEYEATVLRQGGTNDRSSDLNCFWMATDARSPGDLFATPRSGKFADYDQLRTYYVGLGGNGNTTTRFRRYIGQKDNRPLLPEHDLHDPADLIHPNVPQRIRLVAAGPLIQYWRDDRKLFELHDPAPYTAGHFALRTVTNHMVIRKFKVYRLIAKETR